MSSTDNKNQKIGSIMEIDGFLANNVKPLMSNINSAKKMIGDTLSKISSIKDDKLTTESDIKESSKDSATVKTEIDTSAKKVEVVVAEKSTIVKEQAKAEENATEAKIVKEKKVETSASEQSKVATENKSEKIEQPQKTESAPAPAVEKVAEKEVKPVLKTYINPDMNGNRPRRDNNYGNNPRPAGAGYQGNRPAGSTGGYQGNRPAGAGYQGTRPAGSTGGYQGNRPAGAGYQGTRPAGSTGGYQGNRPAGAGYQGNRPAGAGGAYGARPQGAGFGRPQGAGLGINKLDKLPITQLGVHPDTKKKKIVTTFNKDDSKKGLGKRDLLKKGYEIDNTLVEDAETVRYKARKVKKDLRSNFIRIDHAVIGSDIIPIKVLGEKIGKPATEIVKKLFDLGKVANINDALSFDEAEMIAIDFGITLELKIDKTAEDKLAAIVADNTDSDSENMVKRPPIVTIMGHVDHGKTSLLDYIRKTSVVQKEAGGITQHIGAYTIDINGEKITFLDTPGHEAFTAMRRRGAKVTDVAVIVVAADDGIMPQTVEAINHAKEAGVSIVVAVNKIDKTDGNLDKIKQQLSVQNVLAEDWGGDTIICPVSAKTGQGVKELLENILLVAEVLELKANKKCKASGSVIEARLDKSIGPVATVLVQNGTLKVKDYVVAGTTIGKIRAMTDHTGKRVKEAFPSYAVQLQGFTEVPNAGDTFVVVEDEKLAKQVAQQRANKERNDMQMRSNARSLDDMFKNATKEDVKVLPIIIKADVQGSSEAVKQSLVKLSDDMAADNVKIHIIHAGVGAINESDVMLADTASAIIIGFNVRPEPKAKALAEKESVDIRNYRIIYDAIDDIEKALKGMLKPVFKENILGHAEIREVFKISSYGTIAGSYVTDGKVSRNSSVRLLRENIVVFEGMLSSLRREKDDVKDVAAGYECGIGLEKFGEIKKGDIIESFILEKVVHE